MRGRWLAVVVIALGLMALVLFALPVGQKLERQRARKEWKDRAVARIGSTLNAPGSLAVELERSRAGGWEANTNAEVWLSDQFVFMTNGEWIAYANTCAKQNWKVDDLFVGRGSDGKWYYSTYHFCIGMLVLRMEEQPPSLKRFAEEYFLREFDGHSD